ncbi:lysozyme [Apodospora peruviana]|uniref:Lysozyme n=1 Tax=Apodospora peruviana TaxID=516989 RepID=A0AAE0HT47_9PEZI|nr:lysozyme [Apodospora peruviana]
MQSIISKTLLVALSMASASHAMPVNPVDNMRLLSTRQTSCTLNAGQTGTCISTSACASQGGTFEAGHCPGASDIQCCTLQPVCAAPAVNDDTILLLQTLEGFVPTPYPDAGKYSIGYGHQCSQPQCAEMTVPIDQTTAVSLMTADLQRFEKCLTAKVGGVWLNEYQYGALISWTYNVGCGNMETSTLVRRLVAGEDPNTVAGEELPKWRMSEGRVNPVLVNRRQQEIIFFQAPSDVYVLPASCQSTN